MTLSLATALKSRTTSAPYSFVAMAKACRGMLNPGSALLTLSSTSAQSARSLNYNVMGLAKASLEANVRYMANAMGPGRRSRQCHLCRVLSVRWPRPVLKISVNAGALRSGHPDPSHRHH
ncbi:SDR family oxidoreductase [Klebsiella pneumoniae subsp. pneumoniae]|nr:SDR family oxidoreductase [Klebsiella pneumoniae subsp. pneumoniae]